MLYTFISGCVATLLSVVWGVSVSNQVIDLMSVVILDTCE